MREEWRDIKGYEGLYEVSNLGRVRSLQTISEHGYKKILKQYIRDSGYCTVHLSKNKKKTTYYVHRLVSMAFLPNPNNLPCINHKDEIKNNNHVDNLEWCTYTYNNTYKDAVEKRKKSRDYSTSRRRVKQIKDGEVINEFPSIASAYKYLGKIPDGRISFCCQHFCKTAWGYSWEYY